MKKTVISAAALCLACSTLNATTAKLASALANTSANKMTAVYSISDASSSTQIGFVVWDGLDLKSPVIEYWPDMSSSLLSSGTHTVTFSCDDYETTLSELQEKCPDAYLEMLAVDSCSTSGWNTDTEFIDDTTSSTRPVTYSVSSDIKTIYASAKSYKSYFCLQASEYSVDDDYADDTVEGGAVVKFSRYNSKGLVKFMVKLSPYYGTSRSVSKVVAPDSDGSIETDLTIPGFGTFRFIAGLVGDEFTYSAEGIDNEYSFESRTLGGSCAGQSYRLRFAPSNLPQFSNRDVVEELLPSNYVFSVSSSGEWVTGTKPSMSFVQTDGTEGDDVVVYGSGWKISGLGDSTKPNYSGLKFKYTSSSGLLKAKFKVYYTNAAYTTGKPKMKTKTAKAKIVIDSENLEGGGKAAVKISSTIYSWPVFLILDK